MQKSATNLYQLLENLLEWSLMEQGLIPFTQDVVHLKPIVVKSLNPLLESARYKGIEISYELPGELKAYADSNMLQTILRNLVSNAIKFTDKNGKICISAKAIAGKSIEIMIKDSGVGMKKEMIENLFKIDVKTGTPGTMGESSTGLGLLLCKEFVEKHGGNLRVKSEVNKGSEFYFTIPCYDEHENLTVL